jgi:hypothetical protein
LIAGDRLFTDLTGIVCPLNKPGLKSRQIDALSNKKAQKMILVA